HEGRTRGIAAVLVLPAAAAGARVIPAEFEFAGHAIGLRRSATRRQSADVVRYGRDGMRLAIHASTSEARQPIALALRRTADGKDPRRTRRQTVVRLRPVRAWTSGQRSTRSVTGAWLGAGGVGMPRTSKAGSVGAGGAQILEAASMKPPLRCLARGMRA